MLQSIRDRAQGWFAAIIFGFIILAFGMWGINFYIRTGGEVVVAEVNGEEIKVAEFERDFQQYRRQLQAVAGGRIDVDTLDQGLVRRQALQQIVDEEILKQASRDAGLRVSDGQVAGAIQSFEPFQRDGKFASDLYDRRLRDLGMSPAGFEQEMRQSMVVEQLRQGVTDTAFATVAEIDRIEGLKGQKRDLVYTVIAAEPYKAEIKPSDAEIEASYKGHAERYMTPDLVKIAYLELSVDELAKDVAVTEEELKAHYEEHKADYTAPEERSANHILVHVEKDAKDADVEAARKKAEEYLAEARGGKSFEEIAMAHSDDVGSKAEGGKTGFFRRGVMAKEFDEAAFSMQPGEIRGPIRTDFGFHIVRLNEIHPAVTMAFDEAKADVEKAFRLAAAETLYYEKADQLSTLTYENSDSLEPAAKALDMTGKETDFFPRTGGQDLTADPKVLEAAFSEEVLKERLNSQALEIATGRTVVLRVAEHKPAAPRDLAAVREEIVDAIVAETAKQKASERGKALLERLNKGESRDALAQSEGLQWTEASDVVRSDPNVNRAMTRAAFKLRPAEEGKPVYGGVPMGTGDYAIVGVLAMHDADPGKADGAARQQTQRELFLESAKANWTEYLGAIKAAAEVDTYLDKL